MTSDCKDKNIARLILAISGGIVIYWLFRLSVWLIHWLINSSLQTAGMWTNFGGFCLNNLSIILVVYVIICLQIAGVMEFRYRRNFTQAFFLGIILTPVFMPIYLKLKKERLPQARKEV